MLILHGAVIYTINKWLTLIIVPFKVMSHISTLHTKIAWHIATYWVLRGDRKTQQFVARETGGFAQWLFKDETCKLDTDLTEHPAEVTSVTNYCESLYEHTTNLVSLYEIWYLFFNSSLPASLAQQVLDASCIRSTIGYIYLG